MRSGPRHLLLAQTQPPLPLGLLHSVRWLVDAWNPRKCGIARVAQMGLMPSGYAVFFGQALSVGQRNQGPDASFTVYVLGQADPVKPVY